MYNRLEKTLPTKLKTLEIPVDGITYAIYTVGLIEVFTDLAHPSCWYSTEGSQQVSLHSWWRFEHKHSGSSQ